MGKRNLRKILITLLILNIADFFLTQHIIMNGGSEGNPFMKPFEGFIEMGVIKMIIIPLGIHFIWINRKYIGKFTHKLIKGVTFTYVLLMFYYAYGFIFELFY